LLILVAIDMARKHILEPDHGTNEVSQQEIWLR
jgi:hypothetical protein